MSDLDFSNAGAPAPQTRPGVRQAAESSLYDPRLALGFFQIAGEAEQFPAGAKIFVEQQKPGGFFSKGAHIYLLLEGEVALTLMGKPLNLVMPGETFGEVAVIADAARTATATARKNCRVLSLDEKKFLQSLQQAPEFALMMLSLMAQRLRRSVEGLAQGKKNQLAVATHRNALDARMLADLKHEMGDPTPIPVRAGENIVSQGSVGVSMYVLTAGRVAISVDGSVVEHVGPGGTFGEMALLGRTNRAATATAEADSTWLGVTRNEFLAMVKSNPAFGIALLRSMSERIQHVGKLLGD
jgi:CRP/FNR family transcriptional regulator, cyclic AMP receptor protein